MLIMRLYHWLHNGPHLWQIVKCRTVVRDLQRSCEARDMGKWTLFAHGHCLPVHRVHLWRSPPSVEWYQQQSLSCHLPAAKPQHSWFWSIPSGQMAAKHCWQEICPCWYGPPQCWAAIPKAAKRHIDTMPKDYSKKMGLEAWHLLEP